MKIKNVYFLRKGNTVVADIVFEHNFLTWELKNKRVYGLKTSSPYVKDNGNRIEVPAEWFPDHLKK